MTQKTIRITGWALTIVLGLLFSMSAFMKLTQEEASLAQAVSGGIDVATYRVIGVVEIIALILFIIPRTGILGTMLLAAYMGGAIVTHLYYQQSIAVAVSVQIVVWITALIRFPELKQRLILVKK